VEPRLAWSVRRVLVTRTGAPGPAHGRVGHGSLGLIAALTMALAACGGGASKPAASTPPKSAVSTPVSGPILALVTAASVDAAGQPSGVSQAFAPSQPQVTALVVLGRLGTATDLAVTWSQVTAQGSQPLFTQHIAVADLDRAFSTALSRGVLASGIYQVSASIGAVTTSTAWIVTPAATNATLSPSLSTPTGATVPTTARAGAPARPANLDAFSEQAGSSAPQPPTSGPSGAIPPPRSPLVGCTLGSMASMNNPDRVSLYMFANCPPPGPGVTYSGSDFAAMQGPLRLLGPLRFGSGWGDTALQVNVCSLPAGSDLPGAVLTYDTVVYKPTPTENLTNHFTLPADDAAPVVTAGSTPPHGTKVQAGQTIRVHITATEPTNLGPQEGIHDIDLSGPAGLMDAAVYGNHPTVCDKSRFTKTLTTTYTVPANPPPVIHLSAIAHDFANNESATISADFPTGDLWTGTIAITTSRAYIENAGGQNSCHDSWTGKLSFVVGANHKLAGSGALNLTGVSCSFPLPAGTGKTFAFSVSGTQTATGFTLVLAQKGKVGGIIWAGLNALMTNGACSGAVPGPSIAVPSTGANHAAGPSHLRVLMNTGCNGSENHDILTATTTFSLSGPGS
jgi:hypothetical protein